jgi:hypothetical protein
MPPTADSGTPSGDAVSAESNDSSAAQEEFKVGGGCACMATSVDGIADGEHVGVEADGAGCMAVSEDGNIADCSRVEDGDGSGTAVAEGTEDGNIEGGGDVEVEFVGGGAWVAEGTEDGTIAGGDSGTIELDGGGNIGRCDTVVGRGTLGGDKGATAAESSIHSRSTFTAASTRGTMSLPW